MHLCYERVRGGALIDFKVSRDPRIRASVSRVDLSQARGRGAPLH
jgi:hypothetical protein